jgi:branched-subunit amino acid ABC-type transport system permease component
VRIPAEYKPAIVYAAVILVLLLRPSGLMRGVSWTEGGRQ